MVVFENCFRQMAGMILWIHLGMEMQSSNKTGRMAADRAKAHPLPSAPFFKDAARKVK